MINPTNEAGIIRDLIKYLIDNIDSSVIDLIVSDGGSDDNTIVISKKL